MTTLTLPTYRPLPGRYDEMIGPDGSVRPAWRGIAETVSRLTDTERAERVAAAERRLVATGAAHSHDGRPAGAWQIDPVPLVLGEPGWSRLSAGLEQRVRLLNLVLDDLYSDRRVVSQGLVPPELVLGADGYQPAAWGWKPRGARITRYAADVVRAADGSFRVLRDHADAPSGAARALVNRVVTTRVMSDVSSLNDVASLNPFFDRLRAALSGSAAASTPSPHVVVLAPAPSDPEFIEYSLLATHLGYNVVEAADLVVSGGRVWLRAVAGHEPVDVIVRGVTDPSTDALEMLPFAPAACRAWSRRPGRAPSPWATRPGRGSPRLWPSSRSFNPCAAACWVRTSSSNRPSRCGAATPPPSIAWWRSWMRSSCTTPARTWPNPPCSATSCPGPNGTDG